MDLIKFYTMKKNIGFYIMLGLVVLGICVVVAVNSYRSYDRVVSVKGLCEREVMADKVIWPLVYKVVGNDMQSIYADVKHKNNVVKEYLVANGIKGEDISVAAPNIIDLEADRYSYNNTKPYRYNVTSVITVASRDVEKVRELISKQGDLISKGVAIVSGEYDYRTTYEFTGLNEIKPQMIEEATANARMAAQKFADDSESNLGKIKRANQGQFSVEARDANTPYIKKVRAVISVDYYLK